MPNPVRTARIESPLSSSVYTPTTARIKNTEKDVVCWTLLINFVNSQPTQSENKLCDRIMAMKLYFMEKLHNICTEIVSCKNKTKNLASADVEISKLESKIGTAEMENKLLE